MSCLSKKIEKKVDDKEVQLLIDMRFGSRVSTMAVMMIMMMMVMMTLVLRTSATLLMGPLLLDLYVKW